jgi:hypothetical protein
LDLLCAQALGQKACGESFVAPYQQIPRLAPSDGPYDQAFGWLAWVNPLNSDV